MRVGVDAGGAVVMQAPISPPIRFIYKYRLILLFNSCTSAGSI